MYRELPWKNEFFKNLLSYFDGRKAPNVDGACSEGCLTEMSSDVRDVDRHFKSSQRIIELISIYWTIHHLSIRVSNSIIAWTWNFKWNIQRYRVWHVLLYANLIFFQFFFFYEMNMNTMLGYNKFFTQLFNFWVENEFTENCYLK